MEIIDHSELAESLLAPFADQIGPDFAAYRAHVYRVLTYSMHFLGGDQTHRTIVETALVYHDIGLWTNDELAYLEPSESLAERDNVDHGWGLDEDLLRNIIHWHHKVRPWSGPNAEVVNACRKADWIAASGGIIRKGLSKAQIAAVQSAIPDHGFHGVLLRLAGDLGGNVATGGLRITRSVLKL